MITFDGDRSKRRKWYAEKQAKILESLDLTCTSSKWDGFLFKTTKVNDIVSGRVTAPAGLIVLHSTKSGIQIAMLEFWGGSITAFGNINTIGFSPESSEKPAVRYFEFLENEEDFTDAGYTIQEYEPNVLTSVFGTGELLTEGGNIIMDTETEYDDLPCTPDIFPYESSEALWMTITDRMEYPDANPATGFTYSKYVLEHAFLYYMSNNSSITGHLAVLFHEDWHWSKPAVYHWPDQRLWSTTQRLNKSTVCLLRNSLSYPNTVFGNMLIVSYEISAPVTGIKPQSISYTTLESLIPEDSGIPEVLRTNIITLNAVPDQLLSCAPMGTYRFILDGVEYFFHAVRTITDSTTMQDYYEAHPSNSKWSMFYIFKIGEVTTLVDSSSFLALLDSYSSQSLVSNTTQVAPDYEYDQAAWTLAAEVFMYITQVPPNYHNSIFPYDSYMFHTHDGKICSWSRRLGCFRISVTGIEGPSDFTFILPSEVTTEDGVQPTISYAGTYDEGPCYLCICNKVKDSVKGIYYGSPFDLDSWNILPTVQEIDIDYTLIFARPIKVSYTEVRLLGVIKYPAPTEEDPTKEEYKAAYLSYTGQETDMWQFLSMLPFEVDDESTFNMSLFGNDPLVYDIINYPSPTGATPQIQIAPNYSSYNSAL